MCRGWRLQALLHAWACRHVRSEVQVPNHQQLLTTPCHAAHQQQQITAVKPVLPPSRIALALSTSAATRKLQVSRHALSRGTLLLSCMRCTITCCTAQCSKLLHLPKLMRADELPSRPVAGVVAYASG